MTGPVAAGTVRVGIAVGAELAAAAAASSALWSTPTPRRTEETP
jgi:hypothetical protein